MTQGDQWQHFYQPITSDFLDPLSECLGDSPSLHTVPPLAVSPTSVTVFDTETPGLFAGENDGESTKQVRHLTESPQSGNTASAVVLYNRNNQTSKVVTEPNGCLSKREGWHAETDTVMTPQFAASAQACGTVLSRCFSPKAGASPLVFCPCVSCHLSSPRTSCIPACP
ncbi:unnamed protein product [Pleuronectes platessa]|uniref:Uncharacterized protein n=1 Tax=Pleuronectes platessa TaxID=8262 RepID=A0A9N7U2K6_PLEPL|nr:unnamed protein product [Pleuronectes platessa]